MERVGFGFGEGKRFGVGVGEGRRDEFGVKFGLLCGRKKEGRKEERV